jgi:DNA gyrase subunit A
MASKDIRTIGRATQGVRLIDIEGDDRAVSIARLAEKDEEDTNGGNGGEPVPPAGESS